MKVQSSKDMGLTKVNSLSIADAGKGKTYFIGTMTEQFKPFVVDTEGGLMSISDKEFDYVSVNSFQEFSEAFSWYMQNYEEKGYTHFVLDSFSRLQQYLIRDLGGEDGKITLPQWGEVLAKLRKTVDVLTKQCPTSVHVTTMAAESRDELTGMVKIYPNVQGSFRYDLSGYFDVVLWHDCGEKNGDQVYWVQTQGDERIVARARTPRKLPKHMANNYVGLYNTLRGE